ncbi:hypothetical protein C8J56DRAFT_963773, partial [Mycena floridula]
MVWINIPSFTLSLFRQVHDRLSRLEVLYWNGLPNPSTNFIVAPSLWKINLTDLSCTQAFPQWPQLKQIIINTSYGLARASDQLSLMIHDLRILQGSRQLVRLELDSKVDFSSLRQAELQFDHLRILRCSLSMLDMFLTLPALKDLDLTWGQGFESFPAFLHRTAPKLRSLTLPSLVSDERFSRSVIDGLDMLPSHTILSMHHYPGTLRRQTLVGRIQSFWQEKEKSHAIIDHLRVDPDHLDQAPVPNLQHLRFWGNFIPGFLDMVESRFSTEYAFPRLKSLEWSIRAAEDPKVTKRINILREQGLKVKLRWM